MKIAIGSVTASAASVPVYDPVELTVDLHGSFRNPYDPDQISVEAQVEPPLGKPFAVPAFWYVPFKRTPTGPQPDGAGSWRIRIALTETGAHKIIVSARDRTGAAQSAPVEVQATPGTSHGFVQVSAKDFRYFAFADGVAYFPIGSTLPAHSLPELETWFKALAAAGGNAARLMLSPPGSPFALQNRSTHGDEFDPLAGFRIDEALQDAQESGLQAILCLGTPAELEQRDPGWVNNPLSRDNGGPLDTPKLFWSDPVARSLYAAKLRYLVARYGAFRSMFAWELWRDADRTYGYDSEATREWFDSNSQKLQSLDPYGHPVTVSFADPLGDRTIDRLPGISFVQSHIYDVPDLVPPTTLQQAKKTTYGKPHWVTEVAASRSSAKAELDANGLQVHDPLWASAMSGAAGAAMPWWWESYVFPKRISNRFKALASFVKGIDWPSERFRPTTPTFDYQKPPAKPVYRDLTIANGPISFGNTEYNLPRYVRIYPKGVEYGLPVSGILHGQKLHASKFNPIRFTMDLRRPTYFEILVKEVSGLGGGYIQAKLDGDVVMGLDLRDPDGTTDDTPLTKYNGAYGFNIPAGHHVLTVANTGLDWVKADYRFRDLLVRKTPPLLGVCQTGDNTVVAWIRHADRSWDRVEVQKRPVVVCPPTVMSLRGLLPGKWRVELWDTWTGKAAKSYSTSVGTDGDCFVNLPEISADLAVKMTRLSRTR